MVAPPSLEVAACVQTSVEGSNSSRIGTLLSGWEVPPSSPPVASPSLVQSLIWDDGRIVRIDTPLLVVIGRLESSPRFNRI